MIVVNYHKARFTKYGGAMHKFPETGLFLPLSRKKNNKKKKKKTDKQHIYQYLIINNTKKINIQHCINNLSNRLINK